MGRLLRPVAFILCGLLLAAAPAAEQNAVEAATAWGLLGTWALDCGKPASRPNPYLGYFRHGRNLVHRRDFGDVRDEHTVTSARILEDGALEIVVDLAVFGQVRTIVFRKEGEGKKRAVLNRDDAGNYSIKDGKFVANGQPSPVQTRCSAATG